jgi:two-component system, NtrC family, C4-dicarboxylate transport response regulator DctD
MNPWRCNTVALVDDDDDLRHALTQLLELGGLDVQAYSNGEAALACLNATFRGVVLSDVRMPGMDGLELQARLHEIDPDLPVILLTGHGDVPMAVSALQRGAYDFLTKPFVPEQILSIAKRALESRSMHLELIKLRQGTVSPAWPLIGESPVMQQLARTIQQVGGLDIEILIEGETGTGKGLVAKSIHQTSARARRAMVTLDCGALNETNVSRELFGVAPGHISGASQRWIGHFEQANTGTLFLDCIDSLDRGVQQRLERTLETRAIFPVGRSNPEAIDVRIISASKIPLAALVAEGRFSGPLYYRLNSLALRIPPLRERRDDVPILFSYFLQRACTLAQRDVPKLSPAIWRRLSGHDWPGNVRELMNFADQVALGLDVSDIVPSATTIGDKSKMGLKDLVADYETGVIEDALRKSSGAIHETIKALDLPRKTFYDKVKRLGIDLSQFKKR